MNILETIRERIFGSHGENVAEMFEKFYGKINEPNNIQDILARTSRDPIINNFLYCMELKAAELLRNNDQTYKIFITDKPEAVQTAIKIEQEILHKIIRPIVFGENGEKVLEKIAFYYDNNTYNTLDKNIIHRTGKDPIQNNFLLYMANKAHQDDWYKTDASNWLEKAEQLEFSLLQEDLSRNPNQILEY